MLILGIDTATKTASVAVAGFDDEKPHNMANITNMTNMTILSEIQSGGRLSHSENLMPMIDYALKTAGVSLNEIDLFAAARGPGSFTGIRIAVATVKGLAFDLGNGGEEKNNCIGISSLYALAYNFYGHKIDNNYNENNILIMPVIDARRKQVYNAVIRNNPNNSDWISYIKHDRIITTAELETELNAEFAGYKIVFTGDGAEMCYNEIEFGGKTQVSEMLKKPCASSLCRAAYEKYINGESLHPRILAPSYLIKTQAEREYNEK